MKNNYYQAGPGLDMIIKVMKNDYQASPGPDNLNFENHDN